MRLCSTPESALEGEITVLAIVETLVAIFLVLLLVQVLDSAAHIVVGAVLTPLVLLRTEASAAKAFVIFDSCSQGLSKVAAVFEKLYERLPPVVRSLTFLFVWLPLLSLAILVIRVIATIETLISSPADSLRAIPGNWLRLTLATDSKHPPEFLAGIETASSEAPASLQHIRYAEVRLRITSGGGSALFQRLSLLAIYGITIIYRLFVKSASLIYFPLIWINQVPITVKGVLSLPLERVRRWYAYIVLLITLGPLLASFHLQNSLATVQDQMILAYVLPIGRVDWWHISRVIAVVVTIALYFFARKLNEEGSEDEERARSIFINANRLRAACGVFTMGCFLLIVLAL